jgi:hypothetical protein
MQVKKVSDLVKFPKKGLSTMAAIWLMYLFVRNNIRENKKISKKSCIFRQNPVVAKQLEHLCKLFSPNVSTTSADSSKHNLSGFEQ